jgi:pimeloyl-ACP methyl ester carboxylesterase
MRASRVLAWIGVGASLALCGCASEPERVAGANFAGPQETPSGQEITPEKAIRHEVAGWVILRCVAGADLSAEKCFVIAETPEGWGFGRAALRTSAGVRVRDARSFGGHVPAPGETFNLPVVFCPPTKAACASETQATIAVFDPQMRQAIRLLGAKDCPGAVRVANAAGVPYFARLITAECAKAN